jgi:poly-gamma-glutamate capsule biosynthesis protein CapA/YwtB (metallophosphatase superfamily)
LGYQPPVEHTVLAHALIRAGADVIFGHSPHVCRGVEVFEDGLILYSTGDFVDDYAVDPIERNDRSWAWEIQVEDRRIARLQLHPTVICDFQARRADPEVAHAMINAMQELCTPFGTVCTVPAGPPRLVVEVRQPAGINNEPAPLTF